MLRASRRALWWSVPSSSGAICTAKIDLWGCQSDALPLMREIKRRFDPNRILNPGRFVGGI